MGRNKTNAYEKRGDHVALDVSTKSHPNTFALVDEDVFGLIAHFRWSATKRKNSFYVRGIVNGNQTLLHRFIMRPPDNMEVDHINGNPLDNRKANMRICTAVENTIFGADRRRGGPKPPPPKTWKNCIHKWRERREKRRMQEEFFGTEQERNCKPFVQKGQGR